MIEESLDERINLAKSLGIDYLLDGSIRSQNDDLRISARLIEVSSHRHQWAQRYDEKNSDIFELQDVITKEVVSALQVELTEGDQAILASRGTRNVEAWQLTYEALVLILAHRQHSVRRGIEMLEQAVQLDEELHTGMEYSGDRTLERVYERKLESLAFSITRTRD